MNRHRPMLPGELAIRVDGVTRIVCSVFDDEPVRLDVGPDAELIEVVAEDEAGEFPLASWLVGFDPMSGRQRPVVTSFELPGGGRRLSLRLTPYRYSASAGRGARLDLRCSAVGKPTGAADAR